MQYKNEKIEIELKNGIVFFTVLIDILDIEIVKEAIQTRHNMSNGKNYPIFADIRKLNSVSREARQQLASKDAGEFVSAVAMLTNSKVQLIMFNFFNLIYKAPSPTKLFTNKEEALQWLEKYKLKEE